MASEYEVLRRKNIEQNMLKLKELGLDNAKDQLAAELSTPDSAKRKTKRKRKRTFLPAELCRRSKRFQAKKPGNVSSGDDTVAEGTAKGIAKRLNPAPAFMTKQQKEEQTKAMIERSRQWIELSRKALVEAGGSNFKKDCSGVSEKKWEKEAVRRWGDKVLLAAKGLAATKGFWEKYVLSRIATPPPRSPYELLQETYSGDIWRLLVACVLMGRVASQQIKERSCSEFFKAYPTPSAALQADADTCYAIMKPLGLFDSRMQSVAAVTLRFLEMAEFKVGLDKETKVRGIGEFGYQSYLIWSRNQGANLTASDRNLRAFCDWLKKKAKEESA